MTANENPAVAYDVQTAKQEAVKAWLRPNSNIVGIGIGKKTVEGKPVDCVRFYVVAKLDEDKLSPKSKLPSYIELPGPDAGNPIRVPTAVIPVGKFGSRGRWPRPQPNSQAPSGPGSRIRVKTSAPNVNEGATGTLGAVVTDDDNKYILSCNHILAVNGRVPTNAKVVDAEFVGNEETIAAPGPFVPLKDDPAPNLVDCALARLNGTTREMHVAFPDGYVLSPGPIKPDRDMKVTKFGATTHRTYGTIVDTDADLYIDYSFGTFRFEHQLMIEGDEKPDSQRHGGPESLGYAAEADRVFARSGDSGSVVLDTATGRPAALIFAASGRFAVACPLTTERGEGALDLLGQNLKLVTA